MTLREAVDEHDTSASIRAGPRVGACTAGLDFNGERLEFDNPAQSCRRLHVVRQDLPTSHQRHTRRNNSDIFDRQGHADEIAGQVLADIRPGGETC
jgi:hypothetical protein